MIILQLDARKKRILQAIIDEHVDTAEPVGSRYIARKRDIGLSSATIRNEMADLEEMGYLAQPHTSSGRVPSDKGYRLYVDDIMETRELSLEEINAVTVELGIKIGEINQLLKRASTVMSKLTKYTTLSMTPSLDDSTIKTLKAVQIDENKLLIVLVTSSETVKNSIAYLPCNISGDAASKLSDIIHAKLRGKSAEGLDKNLLHDIRKETGLSTDVLEAVLDAVLDCFGKIANSEILFDGATNILSFPEFKDVNKARSFLELLEEKKNIANVVNKLSKQDNIKVLIGVENPIDEIKECSIISKAYGVGSIVFGTIGVIGPKRMEYSKVVSALEYISKIVSKEMGKLVKAYEESDKGV